MKYVVIVVIIVAIIVVSKLKKPLTTKGVTVYLDNGTFTYDILSADGEKDEVVDKGVTSEEQFMEVFNQFPWEDQIRIANEKKIQSPTLSVYDNNLKRTFFISMSGDSNDKNIGIGYVVGLTYPQEGKNDSGLIGMTSDRSQIESLVRLFFSRDPNFGNKIKSLK